MLNGFALLTMFIPLLVDSVVVPDDTAPSLIFAFANRHRYYELFRPCAAHRYSPADEGHSLAVLPSHRSDTFSRSA
jgi:hypothetical protein